MNTQLAVTAPVVAAQVSLGTLHAETPQGLIAGAAEMAGTLADLIRTRGLSTSIKGREYVQVEGWTTLGVMLGVTAREVETREAHGIYTAVVELVRMSDGAVVSRASAECGEEAPWCNRPRYARRSMAQTRATGKACRLAFSWIMKLAGYEVTPAEEMPADEAEQPPSVQVISAAQHRRLEARISELGLDRARVKAWVKRAWGVEHLTEIPASKYPDLDRRIEVWATALASDEDQAEREAIQAESCV